MLVHGGTKLRSISKPPAAVRRMRITGIDTNCSRGSVSARSFTLLRRNTTSALTALVYRSSDCVASLV
ncbi:hypothetical protein D9M68_267780 [compost metagenome]